MDGMDIANRYNRNLSYAVIIAVVIGFFLLRSFFSLIIIAMIAAYIFHPVYKRLLTLAKKPETAALLTLLVTLAVVIIPVILILAATLLQASILISDLSSFVNQHDFGRIAQDTLEWVNYTGSSLTGRHIELTYYDISSFLAGYATSAVNFIIDSIRGWVGSIAGIIAGVILYMYVFTGLLVHGHKIIKLLQDFNPLGKDITDLYIEKAQGMTKAMIKGQFVIAVIQGVVSAIVLYLVGIPYTMFFVLILTFMSIIPLGAGILTIPLGIIMILLGNTIGGIIVVLNHVLLVTNIDNILKPKLVSKDVRLHPALLLLAVFGGMGLFGFLGIIIGPVLMILIVTTLQVYDKKISKATIVTQGVTTKKAK